MVFLIWCIGKRMFLSKFLSIGGVLNSAEILYLITEKTHLTSLNKLIISCLFYKRLGCTNCFTSKFI